jgi:hypothetical protein
LKVKEKNKKFIQIDAIPEVLPPALKEKFFVNKANF